jgi:hypothetical protein
MSKRRKSLFAILFLVIVLMMVYILGSLPAPTTIADIDTEPSETAEPKSSPLGPTFVVPEIPLGTIGALSAVAGAFLIFSVKKRSR